MNMKFAGKKEDARDRHEIKKGVSKKLTPLGCDWSDALEATSEGN